MNRKNILEHPFVKHSTQVKEICEPLFKNTPINFFEACRIYKNNEYSGFMSDGRWAEHYLKKDYKDSAIVHYQRDIIECDHTLWATSSIFDVNKKAQELHKDCIEFNYKNGLSIIERYNDYTQFYHFASSDSSNFINTFFIDNIELLYKFILYFKEKCHGDKTLFAAYKQHSIMNPSTLNIQNNTQPNVNLDNLNKQLLIKKLYLQSPDKEFYLSRREVECMSQMIMGKTAKEIARILNISYRTVQTHFDNVKERSGITNIRKLRSILLNTPAFKLLYL